MLPPSGTPRFISVMDPRPLVFLFRSTWADTPIDLNAPLNSGPWEGAGRMRFNRGWVLAKNDARFLYLALDVTADTGDDPGTSDYFWLTFDVNRDRAITSGRDINFATPPNQPENLRKQMYLGPNQWTGLQDTPSEARSEFGPSPDSAANHRIWKFRIDLSEIGVNLAWPLGTPHTFLGFRVRSQRPGFLEEVPPGFGGDFSGLRQLVFSRKPSVDPALLGPVIGSVGLIPTTTIAAGGRATTDPGYFIHAENAAFGGTLNLIGNRTRMASLWAAGARKYRVQMAPPGGSYSDLRSSWFNYRWNPSQGRYVLETFAPTAAGVYSLTNPAHDYSIDDLLIQFPTGAFPPGLHRFRVRFFRNDGTTPVSAPNQVLSLFIDNHLPQAVIDSVQHGGTEVSACAIQNLGPAPDGIRFRITAHDPEGNLRSVSLRATYGDNQSAAIFSEGYTPSMGDWAGFTNRLIPPRGTWRPPVSCAYSFIVSAWARTTNGYNYIGRTDAHRNVTLIV
jgi:hypothetical protein